MKIKTDFHHIKEPRIPKFEGDARRWKRFLRESKIDRAVLLALLNARWNRPYVQQAHKAYEQFIIQLMSVFVSPAALARYREGFTDDEINTMYEAGCEIGGVVDAENKMMAALLSMVKAHPCTSEARLEDLVHGLYYRWRYVQMMGEDAVQAISANGINSINGRSNASNVYPLRESGSWTFIPLPIDLEGDEEAGDTSDDEVR